MTSLKDNKKNIIVLVRHGETNDNEQSIIQGNSNLSVLNEIGKKQAQLVARALNGLTISDVYTSTLNRTIETTDIILKNLKINKQVKLDDRLNEINFYSWIGQKREVIKSNNLEKYKNWRSNPFELEIDKKYPVKELYKNIKSFIQENIIFGKDNGSVKLIVCHKGSILSIISTLLNLPKSHHHFLQIDNGSITIIQERSFDSEMKYELFCANEIPSPIFKTSPIFTREERTSSKGELYIVRHGQTKSNISRKYQGMQDIELSSIGENKMIELSKFFKNKPASKIISSSLKRAKESASILALSLNIKLISEKQTLHEFNYGAWEGMSEKDVKKYRHTEYTTWKTNPTNLSVPNAEHINDAYNRSRSIWEYYETDITLWGDNIISIGHDIINRLLICNALGLPAKYLWCFKQTNASLSIIAIKNKYDGKLRLLNVNSSSIVERLQDEYF